MCSVFSACKYKDIVHDYPIFFYFFMYGILINHSNTGNHQNTEIIRGTLQYNVLLYSNKCFLLISMENNRAAITLVLKSNKQFMPEAFFIQILFILLYLSGILNCFKYSYYRQNDVIYVNTVI
jgi:hypothetical protein